MRPHEVFHWRLNKLFWRVAPNTKLSYRRLKNIYECFQIIEANGTPGDLVECGVWKGGAAGVMAYLVAKAGGRRKVHLFDSFEGLPEPAPIDGIRAAEYAEGHASGKLQSVRKCVGPLEDVENLLFETLQIQRELIVIHKGWFQETMTKPALYSLNQISLLRIDADWYESTKICLEELYDRVAPGGCIIIDDFYHWEGCMRATEEYIASRSLMVTLIPIDGDGVYFRKPMSEIAA